jgi:hypothetical protein
MTKSNAVVIDTIREKTADRRSFMRNVGMASAGVGAFLLAAKPGKAQAVTDVDILQFALNLEYLESEFYTMATTGKSISEMGIGITGSGNAGSTTGGKKVTFIAGSTLALSATEIASDERNHVKLIRGALTAAGVMPIAKPAINLDALGIGFGSQEEFITLARAFEDVGVSAYGGAAPLISSKTYLGVAARILAAEALHTGNLRLHAALYQVPIKPVDAVDIVPPPSGKQFISVSSTTGLSLIRTPGQVLYIVFGGQANTTSGGFFPSGVNGTLNTSTAPATTADEAA